MTRQKVWWTLRTGGFTLTELLIVLAVITVLIALLMPVLSRAREHARAVACQSNLRQIGLAVILYAGENGGYLCGPCGIIDPPWSQSYVYYPTDADARSMTTGWLAQRHYLSAPRVWL